MNNFRLLLAHWIFEIAYFLMGKLDPKHYNYESGRELNDWERIAEEAQTCGNCKEFGNPQNFHCADVYPEPNDPACEAHEEES